LKIELLSTTVGTTNNCIIIPSVSYINGPLMSYTFFTVTKLKVTFAIDEAINIEVL